MMSYNGFVRPVQNDSDILVVKLGLKLSQLIDVNLKNQIMTTNVWLNQEWSDYKLKWDPSEYGGIEDINLPAEQIWLPDIVLYNSAEGYFAVSIMTKAKVRFDGHVTWNPPAIFRSSCQIDITYFPFDSQNCHMKFGSWTFGTKIDLRHINDTESVIERGTDLSEYYQNVEWDIMEASAKRNVITYICCPNDFYGDVTFNFKLRRKPLFYTVNLILPCVGITILSFLVFYLPSDSGEKVTLTISILVSLIFFLSVLIETIPSTSLAMPLLGKYLAFTMILITVSVCATVCVLNIHFRTPSTHSMPSWVKRWFIEILPKYIFMTVPQCQSQQASTILPEQLIYPHNLAYVAQQQAVKHLKGQPAQQANDSINKLSLLSSSASAAAAAAAAAAASQSKQATSESHSTRSAGKVSNQQSGAKWLPLDPAGLADWANNPSKLNTSPSSLFLPYLQSEAARRLQLQRSRSSERDSSSNNNNNNNINNNNINNNNICDNKQQDQQQEWPRQTVIAVDLQRAEEEQRKKQQQAANNRQPVERQHDETLAPPAGLLNRLFNRRKSSSTIGGRPGVRKTTRFAGEQDRGGDGKQRSSVHQDSSSSQENDYQHHSHFQARASVCSTNLWRIGPTRRCSLAVPVDYPTYYRPMTAHLATAGQHAYPQPHSHSNLHHDHLQAGNNERQINTVSGCLQNATHYHLGRSMASSDSSSSGPPTQAVGALVNAVAGNLVMHQKQPGQPAVRVHSNQQQQFSGFAQNNHLRGQLSLPPQAGQRQPGVANSPLPTPPPPLPPVNSLNLSDQQLQQINQQLYQSHVATQRTDAHRSQAQGGLVQPGKQAPSSQVNRLILAPDQLLMGSRPTLVLATKRSPYNDQDSFLKPNSVHQACFDNQRQSARFGAGSGEYDSANAAQANLQVHQYNLAGCGQFPIMSRSRSTDHRLCMHSHDNQLYFRAGDQNVPLQNRSLEGARLAVLTSKPNGNNNNNNTVQPGYLLNQSPAQSIGRVLGQAYMQRLQRQPAVYSLSSSTQRPSRSIQRGTTYLLPLEFEQNQQQQQQVRCNSAMDMVRRSRSQTSLDRRAFKPGQVSDASASFNGHHCDHCPAETDLYQSSNKQLLRQCSSQAGHSCQCQVFASDNNGNNNNWRQQAANGGPNLQSWLGPSEDCCLQTTRSRRAGCDDSNTAASALVDQPKMSTLNLMKLMNEVDKAIQNAMFIAQHIDNLDEFESVKENWKYIAMVIDRIFLIVFLFACIVGTVTIFAMVPWSYYTIEKPIDLQLTRLLALNFTSGEPYSRTCQDF